jgi:hypothetical protein
VASVAEEIKFSADVELDEDQVEQLEEQIQREVEKRGRKIDDVEHYDFKIAVIVKLKNRHRLEVV